VEDAHHATPLIATIVIGIGLAFVLGTIATRLRLSPLVGYLLAGVLVGPFTPGFVADQTLALELAEIGVILLMFGVGMHFSLKDLLSVKAIAIPGAIAQITVATLLGMGLAWALGWDAGAGFVFGLALSVASTVVLIRAMQERRLIDTQRGRIAVGWLIVEDLAMVLALVLLPALAGIMKGAQEDTAFSTADLLTTLGITLGKVALFIALMLVVGRRVIPWILHHVAHMGSRELFRLSVLAIALGVAFGASTLFGVSFALGAFFAGMMMGESQLAQRAAEETLPLRDAFAVLFFVSVGMLFDPAILVRAPLEVLATVVIILFGKSVAAFLIVRAFGHSNSMALTISASLAQIGEFSFILAALGMQLELLPAEGRDLIITGALISIFANPLFFAVLDRIKTKPESPVAEIAPEKEVAVVQTATTLKDHAVVVGFGRVGSLVAADFRARGTPVLVTEDNETIIAAARDQGFETIAGNTANPATIAACNLGEARWLMVAIPSAFEAGQIVQQARKINPGLQIIARAHFDAEVDHLTKCGADITIMGEREIAHSMIEHAFGEANRTS
jgi:CPA2 family monovalent cation:H+ antiporter-2